MFAMLGGIAGAGLGLWGALENADAQREANQVNWASNVMNFQQRERERAEAIAMANKLRAEQKLGSTDIRGTSVKFVPGKGWVTTGSPQVLAMMKAQDAEQMKQLTHDLPMRRKVMDRNYVRGIEEEGIADTYRRQLAATAPARSDKAFENQLMQAQMMALRESDEGAASRAFTHGMRTRQNSNFANIAAAMQRQSNDAYMKAALQSKLMARGMGQKEVDTRRNQLANLYNMFATRASQLPEVNYRPQNIDNTEQLAAATKGDITTGQLATGAYGAKGGTLDYIQPNMGYGNAISGAGTALASVFRAQGAQQAYGGGGGGGSLSFGATGGSGSSGGGYYQRGENLG